MCQSTVRMPESISPRMFVDHRTVVFVDNSDPYADDLETSLAESSAMALAQARNQRWGSDSRASDAETSGLETLSTIATHDRFPCSPLDHTSVSDSISYPSPNRSRSSVMPPPTSPSMSLSVSSNNTNINFLLNPSHSMSPPITANIHTSDHRSASLPSRPAVPRGLLEHRAESLSETDFEVAFLLRHYAEGPGLWYDFSR